MDAKKDIVLLGRRNHAEAMRVAAGLTIFGHRVTLIFMDHEVEDTEENQTQAELLELSDIFPQTTIPGTDLTQLSSGQLAERLAEADIMLNV